MLTEPVEKLQILSVAFGAAVLSEQSHKVLCQNGKIEREKFSTMKLDILFSSSSPPISPLTASAEFHIKHR